jgi:hypothetical protein
MTIKTMTDACVNWLGTGEPNIIQSWYKDRNGADYSGNFAWCDAGITRASVDAGEYDAVCFGQDQAYTPAHAQTFKNHGQWTYGIDGCREGDIVFMDWQMEGPGLGRIVNIDHVEYVTGRQGDLVLTIGFNTLDVCARRVRTANEIVGYGRPNYSQQTPPPPPPQNSALPPLQHSIDRVLVNYCEGADVYEFQRYMHDVRGWKSLVKDGEYGDQSESICRQFQRDSTAHGWPLEADGKFGPKTKYAMLHRPITR